ncbi:hypothetical protein [Nitrobacter hamburgensis]|uniref:hypothetical protein n=1 Tax=Nitrobacter hamburgensis TaxID=912 RepID=UPI0018DEB56E|nr:hypothetical protein [Nitrobacter hamburgensis]
MAGIGVANTSAAIVAVPVPAFIVAVQVVPECITAAGEAMVEVITAAVMVAVVTVAVMVAVVTVAAVMAAAIRLVHHRLA